MKKLTYEQQKEALFTKAQELSYRISGGDGETMRLMDEWYDTVKLQEHFSIHKGLVAINGGDFPLVEDYINEDCIILVTDKIYKDASKSMR